MFTGYGGFVCFSLVVTLLLWFGLVAGVLLLWEFGLRFCSYYGGLRVVLVTSAVACSVCLGCGLYYWCSVV